MKVDIETKNDKYKWIISAGVRDTQAVRTIPGARARRKVAVGEAVWAVPATASSAKQIHETLNAPEWSNEARRHRKVLTAERTQRLAAIEGSWSPFALDPRLAPFQEIGVSYLLQGSGILADDMGLGKSVMGSVAADVGGFNDVLVLTTKSTIGVWMDHLRDWTSIKPFRFHGDKTKRMKVYEEYLAYEGRKALVSSHGLARAHSSLASFGHVGAEGEPGIFNEPFDLCIVDEVHKVGVDPTNKWVRAVWRIAETCGTRWAITGTPINDVPDDLWVIMRFVDKDVLGDSRGSFRSRYCLMKEEFFGGMTNMGIHPDREEEFHWVTDPYMLRRLKRTSMPDLPIPHEPQYIRLPMTPAQATAYRAMSKQMMANLDGKLFAAPDVLAQHNACQYIADGVPEVDEATGLVSRLVPDRVKSNKLDRVLDIAEERRGDPFVVFAESAKTCRMILEGLLNEDYTADIIEGDSSQDSRDASVAMFQSGKLDVLCVTAAGAEGITLTAADLVVFVRESWRAVVNDQMGDRIDRWGQTRPPQRMVLMSEGTVDLSRRAANVHKIDIQQTILKDKKRVGSFLDGSWEP